MSENGHVTEYQETIVRKRIRRQQWSEPRYQFCLPIAKDVVNFLYDETLGTCLKLFDCDCKSVTFLLQRNQVLSRQYTKDYHVGQQIHGYRVCKIKNVEDFQLDVLEFEHIKTNAKHVHFLREDSNKTFSVSFPTVPMDDTGVAHILEHTTLCGSKKYPCRDPFFKMLNRSMANFMNAMTSRDWTMYIYSTENMKDYMNLMSVYVDAVFFPNLRESDFWQEGWRIEHKEVEEKSSPLVFKGVVYNEMKGVFSDSKQLYLRKVMNSLLPSHTYSYESGGDPLFIPELTYDNLVDFHRKHYHPSNAWFITYGDFDPSVCLEVLNGILMEFDAKKLRFDIPFEKRWSAPRRESITCAVDPLQFDSSKAATVSVGYLLGKTNDAWETFLLELVSKLLVNSEKSPFYQSLIASNIGSSYSPDTGFDTSTVNTTFHVGVQGVSESAVEDVFEVIDSTMARVAEEGFSKMEVDVLLHEIELSNKHQKSMFGTNLATSVIGSWIYGSEPASKLLTREHIDIFKRSYENDKLFLNKIIKERFMENQHKLMLVMKPSSTFLDERKVLEENVLKKKLQEIGETEKELLYDRGLLLRKEQNSVQSTDCLPKLQLSDIDRSIRKYKYEIIETNGTPIFVYPQLTNGVTYFRQIFNLNKIDPKLRIHMPMFCSAFTKLGTNQLDYKELSQRIDLYSGGFSTSATVAVNPSNSDQCELAIIISSYCLDENLGPMLKLWKEIFLDFRNQLEMSDRKERLATLIKLVATETASSVPVEGHLFSMAYSAGSVNGVRAIVEELEGLTQVNHLKEIATMDVDEIIEAFKEIYKELCATSSYRCSLHATESALPAAQSLLKEIWLPTLPTSCQNDASRYMEACTTSVVDKTNRDARIAFPFEVFYCSKSFRSVYYTHEDYAALAIAASLLRAKFLLPEIREKGGAYGAGARNKAGVFSFYSYRDPNSSKTLKTFDDAVNWLIDMKYDDESLNEAKLLTFQNIDAPVSPGKIGFDDFVYGTTMEMQQNTRDRLFAVTREDIKRVANQYLTKHEDASTCIIGAVEENEQIN